MPKSILKYKLHKNKGLNMLLVVKYPITHSIYNEKKVR